MSRLLLRSVLSLSLLGSVFVTGCAPAHADRVAAPASRPLIPIAVAPDEVRSPYQVEIVADGGESLDTFFHRGRYYVHGANGQHYSIRVSNPTAQRIEAVVSVDGIDVIDGENGDIRKRGYVVPAYGSVVIDGWRTSLTDVASFRFSSVGASYAGKKGKARNVGVIAVALFAEVPPPAPPQIIVDEPYDDDDGEGYYGDEVDVYLDHRGPGSADKSSRAPTGGRGEASGGSRDGGGRVAVKRPAPRPRPSEVQESGGADAPSAPTTSVGGGSGGAVSIRPPSPPPPPVDRECCAEEPKKDTRLGLGTEYGEQRYSAASYTKFVRAGDRPIAIAELRYNDSAGLKALGVLVEQLPDENEITTRETADPFPGDRGFARPPAGIR